MPKWATLWLPVIVSFAIQVPAAVFVSRFTGLAPRETLISILIAAAGPLALMPGLMVEQSALRQSFARGREEEIRRSYPALPARWAFGTAAGPALFAELPVLGPVFAQGGVHGALRHLPAAGRAPWTLGAGAELGAGVKF